MKRVLWRILAFLGVIVLGACSPMKVSVQETEVGQNESEISVYAESQEQLSIQEGEAYYSRAEVAEYIHKFGKLPKNYIRQEEAEERDWHPGDGSGLVIGGDTFGNREGLLPDKAGRKYYEADLCSGYSENRGVERLVFSNDGYIFYTEDHYDSFEKLYEPEE